MEKTEGEVLKERLFNNKKNGWDTVSEEERREIFKFADEYMYYLNGSKTEKEIVETTKDILLKNNFRELKTVDKLSPGEKVFYINRDRSIYIAVIGTEPIENGINVVAAHADSPRIDLKQNPLYEQDGLALFKTHYYGGIKKYQWGTIPLSMHGLVVKSNGEKVKINIGEKDDEPTFVISDLPPHLAQGQYERKLATGITGEELNVMVGSIPYEEEKMSERIKLNILKLLNEKYGIKEIDFASSEIEFVPAFKAKSLGLDSSLVAAYGQDDKICCYTALRGILNIENPRKTAVCVLIDKEEIGFEGVTGMYSKVFDTFVCDLIEKTGENRPNLLERVFTNSKVLSADVEAGYDPTFSDVFDKRNSAIMGSGVAIAKYNGARGKSGSSESPAEFVAEVRRVFEENNVAYQMAELGKVDKGGGGTISVCFSQRGMTVLDCGVPLLAMHSPYEITSKFDIYKAYKGYEAFYKI